MRQEQVPVTGRNSHRPPKAEATAWQAAASALRALDELPKELRSAMIGLA